MAKHHRKGDWQRFLWYAAYVRAHPRFEMEERQPKLDLAERLRELVDHACAGESLMQALDNVFYLEPDRPYRITPPGVVEWTREWAAADEESLRSVLSVFRLPNQSANRRFAGFEEAADAAFLLGAAKKVPGRMLMLGSLLNFGVEPRSLPIILPTVFRSLEQLAGFDRPADGIQGQYANHLSFAGWLQHELRLAGIPVRDMLDVQGLIFQFSLCLANNEVVSPRMKVPPSSVEVAPQRVERPSDRRTYLSICACLGYDAPYLLEWIEFHRLVGVEQFFLYNNGDRAVQRELLAPYVRDGVVVLHDWPIFPPQMSAFSDCLAKHRPDSRWIAFIDTDEFLFSPTGESLSRVLTDYEGWPGVGVNRVNFFSSGHITKPEGLVIENYRQRGGLQHDRHIKSIIDPTRAVECVTPHHFRYANDALAVDENHYPIWAVFTAFASLNRLRINHYFTKSDAEYRAKLETRRPDTGTARADRRVISAPTKAKLPWDDTIAGYIPALKESLSRAPITKANSKA